MSVSDHISTTTIDFLTLRCCLLIVLWDERIVLSLCLHTEADSVRLGAACFEALVIPSVSITEENESLYELFSWTVFQCLWIKGELGFLKWNSVKEQMKSLEKLAWNQAVRQQSRAVVLCPVPIATQNSVISPALLCTVIHKCLHVTTKHSHFRCLA